MLVDLFVVMCENVCGLDETVVKEQATLFDSIFWWIQHKISARCLYSTIICLYVKKTTILLIVCKMRRDGKKGKIFYFS